MAKNLNVLGFMDSVAKTSESQNISKNKEDAEIEFNLLSLENSMSKNLDFLSQIKKITP